MKRSKIEVVFKFYKYKEVLGWEKPRVDNFECFKNILALVFSLQAIYETVRRAIEPQLTSHP